MTKGLLSMFGQEQSPFANWLDPRRNSITQFGAGLVGAGSTRDALRGASQGLAQGAQMDSAYALQKQEEQKAQDQLNSTIQYLQQAHPDLAQAVSNGADMQSVWSEAMRRDGGGGAGGAPSYSMTPVFMTDAEGNPRIGQMSSGGGMYVDGQVMNSLPQGWRITNRPQAMSTIDLGTSRGVFNPNSGQVEGNIPIDNMGAEFDKQIGGNMADNFTDLQVAAQDAQSSLQATLEAKSLLDSGVITGFGADWMLNAGKALQAAGFNVNEDAIANTEAFAATRAQEVGRIIKLFGAGTGLSDADREFATRAAAGQITMNEASIRRILDINERASRNIIARYNEQAQGVQNGQMPSLTMNPPGATGSDNVVDYLDFFNQ